MQLSTTSPAPRDCTSRTQSKVARPLGLAELDELDLLDRDREVLPGAGDDLEEAGRQVVEVAEVVERPAIAGAGDARAHLLDLVEDAPRLRLVAAAI